MKMLSKATLIAVSLSLFAGSAFADRIPREIYKPQGKLIKANRQGDGEYEVEYHLRGKDVRGVARRTITHARKHGFRLVESDIERDDANLKFKRGGQKLEVEIERKNNNRMKYKADLDKK